MIERALKEPFPKRAFPPLAQTPYNILTFKSPLIPTFKPEIKPSYVNSMDDFFDDILDSVTVSKPQDTLVDLSQEKRFLGYQSITVNPDARRRSTILNADPKSNDGVIYSFRQLQEYKQSNPQKFDQAKEFIIMQARMAQDLDGCGGVNERGNSGSDLLSKGSKLSTFSSGNILGKDSHSHEDKNHNHCEKHGKEDCTECAA